MITTFCSPPTQNIIPICQQNAQLLWSRVCWWLNEWWNEWMNEWKLLNFTFFAFQLSCSRSAHYLSHTHISEQFSPSASNSFQKCCSAQLTSPQLTSTQLNSAQFSSIQFNSVHSHDFQTNDAHPMVQWSVLFIWSMFKQATAVNVSHSCILYFLFHLSYWLNIMLVIFHDKIPTYISMVSHLSQSITNESNSLNYVNHCIADDFWSTTKRLRIVFSTKSGI
jgi:hypothetical protein